MTLGFLAIIVSCMDRDATRPPRTGTIVSGLRVLLVLVVLAVGFLGVIAGSLITDACPSSDGCSQVELLALGHVPLQVVIGVAGVVMSLRLTRPGPRIVALLASLALSPIAAVVFHSIVVAYMNRLPGVN